MGAAAGRDLDLVREECRAAEARGRAVLAQAPAEVEEVTRLRRSGTAELPPARVVLLAQAERVAQADRVVQASLAEVLRAAVAVAAQAAEAELVLVAAPAAGLDLDPAAAPVTAPDRPVVAVRAPEEPAEALAGLEKVQREREVRAAERGPALAVPQRSSQAAGKRRLPRRH